jgi:hypothetical protein
MGHLTPFWLLPTFFECCLDVISNIGCSQIINRVSYPIISVIKLRRLATTNAPKSLHRLRQGQILDLPWRFTRAIHKRGKGVVRKMISPFF